MVFASSRGARLASEGSDGRSTGGGAAAAFAGLVAAATRAAAAAPAAPRGRPGGGRGGGGGRDRFMRRANTTIARLRKLAVDVALGKKAHIPPRFALRSLMKRECRHKAEILCQPGAS